MGTFDNETVTIFINAFFALAGVTAALVVAAFVLVWKGRATTPAHAPATPRVVSLPATARDHQQAA